MIYGSPYLWDTLKPLLGEGIPAIWSPGQMPLAQREVMACLNLPTEDSEAGEARGERRRRIHRLMGQPLASRKHSRLGSTPPRCSACR